MNRYRSAALVCVSALVGAALVVAAAQNSDSSGPQSRPADSDGFIAPLGGPARHGLGRPLRMSRGERTTTTGPAAVGQSLLDDEQIEQLMTLLRQRFPLQYQRLSWAREHNPAQFQRMINRNARFFLPILNAARNNPELAEKMMQEHQARLAIQELKEKYARTKDDAEKSRLREEIRRQMETAFDARLEGLRLEVQRLQQRLDDAKRQLTDQEQSKSRMIDQHLKDLLSESR